MRSRSPFFAALALVCAFAAVLVARGQQFPWQTGNGASAKAPDAVQFLGPEQVEVKAGGTQQVDLRFRVAPGFHINSHAPHTSTLIPTQLIVADGSGLEVRSVDFPPGTEYSFSFAPNEKLSVYTGDVVLQAHMTAEPGSHLLQGALRYQACDSNSCMPPKKIPVAVSILAK